ncbi:MAG: ankyrin repeat domain-containing protein [Vicinamibacteria bacterium]
MTRPRIPGLKLMWISLTSLMGCHGVTPATPLSQAIVAGDVKKVEALLKAGQSPDEGPVLPIVWAARAGQVDSIRLLVAAGVDVNTMDDGGNRWTPLQHALHKRKSDAARALVEAGADVSRHSAGQMPPLMMAAGYGDLRSVKMLLDHGADASFEFQPGITATWAAAGGMTLADLTDGPPMGTCFPEIVRLLREKAPNVRFHRNTETRFLRVVAKNECAALIESLTEGGS